MTGFWEEFRESKRQAEIQQTGKDPKGPWWASNGITPGQSVTPPVIHPYANPYAQQVADPLQPQQEERYETLKDAIENKTTVDPRKVDHIKTGGNTGCPDCGNATIADLGFNAPSSSLERHPEAAARCFYCGYNSGRSIHSVAGNLPAITDGRSYQAHQPQNGVIRQSVLR
jgi:hypothetical protein